MKTNFSTSLACLLVFIGLVSSPLLRAQSDSTFRQYFVGSSAFVLVNLVPDQVNPPDFVLLSAGKWLNRKNTLAIEAITWKYNAPLGIPYGPSYESPDEEFPGYVRSFGIGVAYQHYWWKGLYTAVHVTPFLQRYFDEDNHHIQDGFQLFTAGRLGYHLPLFKNRFYIEPSVACTFWPVNANMPESFQKVEDRWSNFFFPEPGLHLGVKF
ncbi:hypothetical protein KFE98_20905 [bacterium SCSIO 12741]|nr:hypothetical protein KFE98_20905 [bacterium SCSIO 12741]